MASKPKVNTFRIARIMVLLVFLYFVYMKYTEKEEGSNSPSAEMNRSGNEIDTIKSELDSSTANPRQNSEVK